MPVLLDLPVEIWLAISDWLAPTDRVALLDALAGHPPLALIYRHLCHHPIKVVVTNCWPQSDPHKFTVEQWLGIDHHLDQVHMAFQADSQYHCPLEFERHEFQTLARLPEVKSTSWDYRWGLPPDLRLKTRELVLDLALLFFNRPNLTKVTITELDGDVDLVKFPLLKQVVVQACCRHARLVVPGLVLVFKVTGAKDSRLNVEWPQGALYVQEIDVRGVKVDWEPTSMPLLQLFNWDCDSPLPVDFMPVTSVYAEGPILTQIPENRTKFIAELNLVGLKLTWLPEDLGGCVERLRIADNLLTTLRLSGNRLLRVYADNNPQLYLVELPQQTSYLSLDSCGVYLVDRISPVTYLSLRDNSLSPHQDLRHMPDLTTLIINESLEKLYGVPVSTTLDWLKIIEVQFQGFPVNVIPPQVPQMDIHMPEVPFKYHEDVASVNIDVAFYPETRLPQLPAQLQHLRLHRTKLVTFPSLELQVVDNLWTQLPRLNWLRRLEITDSICLDLDMPVLLPMLVEWVLLNVNPENQDLEIRFDGTGPTQLKSLLIDNGVMIPLHWSWLLIGHNTNTWHPKLARIRTQWAPGMQRGHEWVMPWAREIAALVFADAPDDFLGFWYDGHHFHRD